MLDKADRETIRDQVLMTRWIAKAIVK